MRRKQFFLTYGGLPNRFLIKVLVPRGLAVGEGQAVPPPGAAVFKERQNEYFNSTNVQLLSQVKGNLTIEFGFF